MLRTSSTEQLLERIKSLKNSTGVPRTLFAACPNSVSVIRAAIRSAKRNCSPIKFAATLNQVDMDGGYTGMNHAQFVTTIRREMERIHFTGPVIIAMDHGGPWLRDFQRTEGWSLDKTMNWVKKSFEDAIKAGYDLIHVDPTVDIGLSEGDTIAIELVVERTVELMAHCEKYRRASDLPPIAYEVGTEEVHGGLADLDVFKQFFELLKDRLVSSGFEDIWPCFVVGKVGTDLHTTQFDPDTAMQLASIASMYGSVIKGHYTDNVNNPEEYPASGMGGANVGPEFTEREYEGLMELDALECDLSRERKIDKPAAIRKVLWDEVIGSGRWKKWVSGSESQEDFSSISFKRQEWLVKTGCRYIWNSSPVLDSRRQLYTNLAKVGIDGEKIVLSHIENSMDKYFRSFNLINLNDLL